MRILIAYTNGTGNEKMPEVFETRDGDFKYRFDAVGGNCGIVDYVNNMKDLVDTCIAYGAWPLDTLEVTTKDNSETITFNRAK